jgi:hypothetical protein
MADQPLQLGAFHSPPPQVAVRQVHYRPAQVPPEGIGIAQAIEPPGDPDERLLHEVLRQLRVASEKVGQPECFRAVAQVKNLQVVPIGWITHRILGSR